MKTIKKRADRKGGKRHVARPAHREHAQRRKSTIDLDSRAFGGEQTPKLYDRVEAAKFLDVSGATIRRMQAKGDLEGQNIDGKWLFSEDELVTFLGRNETTAADLTDAALKGLTSAQEHARALIDLVVEPTKVLMSAQTDEIRANRARITELETRLTQQLDVVEAAKTKENERLLQRMAAEGDEKRKEHVFHLLSGLAPIFVKQLLGAKAQVPTEAPEGDSPAESEALWTLDKIGAKFVVLMAKLSREHYELITKSGIFGEEDLEFLKVAREIAVTINQQSTTANCEQSDG